MIAVSRLLTSLLCLLIGDHEADRKVIGHVARVAESIAAGILVVRLETREVCRSQKEVLGSLFQVRLRRQLGGMARASSYGEGDEEAGTTAWNRGRTTPVGDLLCPHR